MTALERSALQKENLLRTVYLGDVLCNSLFEEYRLKSQFSFHRFYPESFSIVIPDVFSLLLNDLVDYTMFFKKGDEVISHRISFFLAYVYDFLDSKGVVF